MKIIGFMYQHRGEENQLRMGGKKESYKLHLTHFLDEFLKTGNKDEITGYLVSNSNLPSPRGNLELAMAFAEVVEVYSSRKLGKLWELCLKLTEISADEAPTNNPKEFLTFCGTYALGAIASVSPRFFEKALVLLRGLADDTRWRIREAVAMGIQKLLTNQSQNTLIALENWIEGNNWLAMRAIAAGVAEPPILKDNKIARRALELHKKIFAKILHSRERKSYEFRTLRKGLGYTLSVVVCATPKEGFAFIRQLVGLRDADILWIIKQNLKKNRLIKNFPNDVTSIKELLKAKAKQ
jgi:hypothetical protein